MNVSLDLNYQQSVFLDDTALTAYMNPNDPRYMKARSLFLDLDDLERHLVTTNYIIFDTHQWLRDDYGYASCNGHSDDHLSNQTNFHL